MPIEARGNLASGKTQQKIATDSALDSTKFPNTNCRQQCTHLLARTRSLSRSRSRSPSVCRTIYMVCKFRASSDKQNQRQSTLWRPTTSESAEKYTPRALEQQSLSRCALSLYLSVRLACLYLQMCRIVAH